MVVLHHKIFEIKKSNSIRIHNTRSFYLRVFRIELGVAVKLHVVLQLLMQVIAPNRLGVARRNHVWHLHIHPTKLEHIIQKGAIQRCVP
jgi:hypothetical protein